MTSIINITDDFLIFFKNSINIEEKKIDFDLNKLINGIYYMNKYEELQFNFLDPYIKFSLFIV
jgi:hypothetical protein